MRFLWEGSILNLNFWLGERENVDLVADPDRRWYRVRRLQSDPLLLSCIREKEKENGKKSRDQKMAVNLVWGLNRLKCTFSPSKAINTNVLEFANAAGAWAPAYCHSTSCRASINTFISTLWAKHQTFIPLELNTENDIYFFISSHFWSFSLIIPLCTVTDKISLFCKRSYSWQLNLLLKLPSLASPLMVYSQAELIFWEQDPPVPSFKAWISTEAHEPNVLAN